MATATTVKSPLKSRAPSLRHPPCAANATSSKSSTAESLNGDVPTEFESFIAAKRDSELDAIIEAERLGEGARDFAYDSLREGYVPDEGTGLSSILPPARRFGGGGSREAIRSRVLDALRTWVERFSGLGGL